MPALSDILIWTVLFAICDVNIYGAALCDAAKWRRVTVPRVRACRRPETPCRWSLSAAITSLFCAKAGRGSVMAAC
jgi:hypothetical protein